MTEGGKDRHQLALRGTRHSGYEVGYGKPPRATRFKNGQSGNPRGRPKGARNKLAGAHEERLKSIVMQEAYRRIRVRDGDKTISVPVATAVVRALAVSGAKGNNRAALLFTQMIHFIEQESRERHWGTFRSLLNYKDIWGKELRRRERLGLTETEPVPHPDDIILDVKTGDVTVKGPLVEEQKDAWLFARILKEEFRRVITEDERKLVSCAGKW